MGEEHGPDRSGGQTEVAYRNPALTVDGVVLNHQMHGLMGSTYSVLLIERGRPPFQGRWALPGGFVDYGEDIGDAPTRAMPALPTRAITYLRRSWSSFNQSA